MKKSITDIKGVTTLSKNQQSTLAGDYEPSWHYNCYSSYDSYDDCYWEFY
ncbi:hypothetical protein SAMN04487910_4460 [Aquimarina amphilecti]|uniref:Uncharacterized protein n=1 Tax=Aquimarina amphilecti TaxID=1038014 RepID=A0A1H7WLL9_AQUAM|nr:hypothetical protein [Aquimarina amphilecti]SEM22400.1 hypothetical protein SAMN04487910_4460 [Aquimarina amphilecti]